MQSGLATTSMFTRLFVVYETHLVHAMDLQMNLEWFCIWTFSWVCMMMFLKQIVCRFQQQTDVFGTGLRFALFSEAACFSNKFMDEMNGFGICGEEL